MTAEERMAFIEKHARQRAEIQAKSSQLNAEREKFVAQHMNENTATNTLYAVVISAIREQA